MNPQFDFVAIGDIVTDAFIKLADAHIHENIDYEGRELCVRFASKIPFESVTVVPAVGNSPNAAVAAAKLGLKSALVSNLGDDRYGEECLGALKAASVDTGFVKIHPGRKTNYHYVLWFDSDRTILIKHEEYPYELPDFSSPKWVYLSSLGEHSLPFHATLAGYLESHPEIKIAFQPGTFQMKFGTDQLARIYKQTEIFFCNTDEAQAILKAQSSNVKELLIGINKLGPKIVVITDGPKGAYAFDSTSGKTYFMPPYPDPAPPLERTGAGDACSATITAALALGLPLKTALAWGPINSMSVVQKIGAQAGLLTREELEKYLAQAPADYKAREI